MRMSLPRQTAVILASAVVLAGARPGAQATKPTMPGYPAVGDPASVTLLSAGAGPRATLRYKVEANKTQRMEMTTAMSVAVAMNGVSMPGAGVVPTIKMTADIAVREVAASGDMNCDVTFGQPTVEPGGEPAMLAAMQQAAAGMKGLKASATVSPRGVVRNGRIGLETIADPQLRSMLAGTVRSFENLSAPFPEEVVGVGAQWEVRQAVDSAGAVMFQKTVYELVSRDGDAVRLKLSVEQTGPSQAMVNPALPPDATMRVESVSGTSTGTVAIRLDSIVPTSEMSGTTAMIMVASMNGQEQRITATTTLKLNVALVK
jgi:hypothetical protein